MTACSAPLAKRPQHVLSLASVLALSVALVGCSETTPPPEPDVSAATAMLSTASPPMLNILPASGTCEPWEQKDLEEPTRILPVDGVLETQLIVALKKRCVPVFDSDTKTWSNQELSLRTYGFPLDHGDPITGEEVQAEVDDPNIVWQAPGPTLVLQKATAAGLNDGTNLKFTLYNTLEPQADPHACDELVKRNVPPGPTDGPYTPDTAPNCFHGDNSTNFHFHGSHVSPQEHQDFVGLELLPFGATSPAHATHTRGTVAVGEYPYDFDRLRYTQAEGTHWYHAHKHGSTALQVLNGLVGTALIYGEFDRDLEALFESQGGLTERLLVVQQLEELPPGLGSEDTTPAEPLINGQANPIVRMKPGEIQRWRFVGATMQASAKLEIGFKSSGDVQPEVRQVAMDGVQFAPENYGCQPILNGPDCTPGTDDDSFKELRDFKLEPGSRIDILIKAPPTPGRFTMTFDMSRQGLHETVMAEMEEFLVALAEASGEEEPPLLTLVVDPGDDLETPFPTVAEFPKMPAYLADLEGPFKERTVGYEMTNRGQLVNVQFSINGTQYDPACVNETLVLDEEEQWTLTNNSSIAHPFHIHTNPFQLVSELHWDGETGAEVRYDYQPPYVWRDTVAIPVVSTQDPTNYGQAVIRYVAREFTGEFVNHCHILGHEDRGMMHNVQATCGNGQWGIPTKDLSPECRDGNYREAAPKCPEG